MTVYEAEVPGIGRKFELEMDGEERLIVVIHHDGKREVYRRAGEDEDSERLFTMSGKLARQFGSIMEGAYFQPVELENVEVPLGEAVIEWVDVTEGSSLVDQTLEAANIRRGTGASVIAIQRGETTMANPKPDTTMEAGDILIAIGTREEQSALSALVAGDEGTENPSDS